MRKDFVPFIAKLVESQNMKNPKLRSLCQINQVSKEENQRRNLTSINFASFFLPCKTGEECVLQDKE